MSMIRGWRDLFVPRPETAPLVVCFLICFLFGVTQLSWVLAAFSDHYSPQENGCSVDIWDVFGLLVHCFGCVFCFCMDWYFAYHIRSVLRKG